MQIGDTVPAFEAPSTRGTFRLAGCAGRPVVLFFYPKDNTSACTLENRDFTALAADFAAAGIVLAGISRDSVRTHEGFCARQALTHELIADKDEALCTLFDVIKPKVMYGKPCRGVVRSTFLVDGERRLVREWRGVKVPGHAAEVLAAAKALSE